MVLQKLWNIDPGYFRLKHAAKTILAILITLWLLRGEAQAFKLMACVVSGFSMQGVVAKSFISRLKQIIILDLAYFIAFILGLVVRDSVNLSAIVLVVVGFVANYVRRFGLQNSVAPMMGWTLCFFATILPFSSTSAAWNHIHELVIALIVSALVNGLVFSDNYPRLFVSNSNRMFKELAQSMRELRRYVLNTDESFIFAPLAFAGITDTLTHLLESNQAMDESEVFSDLFSKQENQVGGILLQQYALVHAYMMMIDAYSTLSRHQHRLSRPARVGLSLIYKQFESLFNSMTMHANYSVKTERALVSFAKRLTYSPPSEPATIIVLLNLKLSFNLLNRHVAQLIRGSDET